MHIILNATSTPSCSTCLALQPGNALVARLGLRSSLRAGQQALQPRHLRGCSRRLRLQPLHVRHLHTQGICTALQTPKWLLLGPNETYRDAEITRRTTPS